MTGRQVRTGTGTDEKIFLVRPGNKDAAAALKSYQRNTIGALGKSIALFVALAIVWALMTAGTDLVLGLIFYGVASAVAVGLVIREVQEHAAYRLCVLNGEIVMVDPYLIAVWDQLREEQGVLLPDWVRDEEIKNLYSAAKDLRPDMEIRAISVHDPRSTERLLLTEARVRARLLRDVNALRDRRDANQRANNLAAAAGDWATEQEVHKQLDLLRSHRNQAGGTAAAEQEGPR